LDLTWLEPEQITNAIIDISHESRHAFASIFTQLDSLGCKALQLRFFSAVSSGEIRRILEMTRRGSLRHIDLLLPYSGEFSDDLLNDICFEHQRVSRIVIYSAPESRTIKAPGTGVPISFTMTQCDSPSCCGQVLPKYFAINVSLFTEAQDWNTCLNRKLSISADGYIKNCPSMPDSFGHISTTALSDALAAPGYKEVWSIKKDQVKVCRDCEFRYICTDCRAYREDAADMCSKPLKCGYDPYSAEWRKPVEVI
jgi:SPASM domain peptide maturase of grasp-with-spasm system